MRAADTPVTDEAVARAVARIRAQRSAAGRSEFIENPAVYALLSAIADADHRRRTKSEPRQADAALVQRRVPPARYSTKEAQT